MSTISIPTHKITEEAMGDGWTNWREAAEEFAAYLEEKLPGMVADEGDEVSFAAEVTNDSGCVNNPCAYPTVDGEDSDTLSFRVQHAKESLWESFCSEFASTYGA
jgi:hypothetical protein